MLCDSPLSFNAKVPTFQRNDRRCPFRQPLPPELRELYQNWGLGIQRKRLGDVLFSNTPNDPNGAYQRWDFLPPQMIARK